jgi:branched-chain amino acid transport system substrate-binding protein
MKEKKILFVVFALIVSLTILTIPFSSGYAKSKDTKSIKIGVLLPLTGPYAMWGKMFQNSMELALDGVGWKVAGKKIELIIEDEGGEDVSMALEKAKKLVEANRVGLLMGPFYGGSAFSVMPYTSSIPIVNVKWSQPGKNKNEIGNKYGFWVPTTYPDNTYPLGQYAYEEKGIRTVTTIGSDYDCAYEFVEGFTDAFKSKGGKVIQQQWAPLTEIDYTPYLSNLKMADAMVVGTLGPPAKLALFSQYDQLGLFKKMPIFISEVGTLPPPVMQEMGDKIIGVKGVEKFLTSLKNPEAQEFLKSYQAKYKSVPDDKASDAYSGMKVVLAALKATGGDTDPDMLKKALLNVKLNLPPGPFQFSEGRVGMVPLRVSEVQRVGGKLQWVPVKEYPGRPPYVETYP